MTCATVSDKSRMGMQFPFNAKRISRALVLACMVALILSPAIIYADETAAGETSPASATSVRTDSVATRTQTTSDSPTINDPNSDLDEDDDVNSGDPPKFKIHPEKKLPDLSVWSEPDQERIRMYEAMLMFNKKDLPSIMGVAELYMESQHTMPRAKKLLDKAQELTGGGHPDVLALLADYHRLHGQVDRAMELYSESLSVAPVSSTSAAEVRVQYATVLFSKAMSYLEDTRSPKEYECKLTLELCVVLINQAMLLATHPGFIPRLTPHLFSIKSQRVESKQHAHPADQMYVMHQQWHFMKLLLAECYVHLARLYENQAFFYTRKLDLEDQYEPFRIAQRNGREVSKDSVSPDVLRDHDEIHSHIYHLHAMSLTYVRRILKTIIPGYVDTLRRSAKEQREKEAAATATKDGKDEVAPQPDETFTSVLAEAARIEKQLQDSWLGPIESAASGEGAKESQRRDLRLVQAHIFNATARVLSSQLHRPSSTSTSSVTQEQNGFLPSIQLAHMMHASCKHPESRTITHGLHIPGVPDEVTVEEVFDASGSYTILHKSRTDILAQRKKWSQRLDALLAEMHDPLSPGKYSRGRRWSNYTELEKSPLQRQVFLGTFHGLSNLRDQRRLAAIYHLMTSGSDVTGHRQSLHGRTKDGRPIIEDLASGMAESWLDFTAPHLKEPGQINRLQEVFVRDARMDPATGDTIPPADSSDNLRATRRVNLAFVSAFFYTHPVGLWLRGYIEQLDRRKYHITLYWLKSRRDQERFLSSDETFQSIRSSMLVDRVTELGVDRNDTWVELQRENLMMLRARLVQDKPDFLFLSDLPLDTTAYFTAFSRLAPVQVLLPYTHVETSGLPKMDWVLLPAASVPPPLPSPKIAELAFGEKMFPLKDMGLFKKPDENMHKDETDPVLENGVNVTRWIPRRDRAYFDLSDQQLKDLWKIDLPAVVPWNGSVSATSADGTGSDASPPTPAISVDTRTDRAPIYLVAKEAPFYSPTFLRALGKILRGNSAAILVVMVDPGSVLSKESSSPGEEMLSGRKGTQGGMRNVCHERVLDAIEEVLQEGDATQGKNKEKKSTHGSTPFSSPNPDYIASLTSYPSRVFSPTLDAHRVQSGRVRFMARLQHRDEWLNLLENVDVLLQPFPVDGALTALDAIQISVPTVFSSFGQTHAGRMTHAVYHQMGLTDELGAKSIEDYIQRAIRLGTDHAYHGEVRQMLVSNKSKLYENSAALKHFDDFIVESIQHRVAKAIEERSQQETANAKEQQQQQQTQKPSPTYTEKQQPRGVHDEL